MEKRIWSMWWQGEVNAPQPVRLCLASIRRNANGAEVIVLDKNTYGQYVTLPGHILEKFSRGLITITNLSDCIRFALLREHGGLWLDSTILVLAPIPDEVFSLELFSLKRRLPEENAEAVVAGWKWSAYLVGGVKGMPLFNAMFNGFDTYWKEHSSLIAYLLVDYFFDIFTEMSQPLHDAAEAIPVYDGDSWDLLHRHNEVGDLNELNGMFQKLDWRVSYKVYAEGGMTLYGKALQAYDFALEDYVGKDSFTERISSRLMVLRQIPKKYRDFGAYVAVWELLDTCFGPVSHRIYIYIKRHLINAVKEQLKETATEALTASESEIGLDRFQI